MTLRSLIQDLVGCDCHEKMVTRSFEYMGPYGDDELRLSASRDVWKQYDWMKAGLEARIAELEHKLQEKEKHA